ncbi:hypothetical protein ACN28I_11795 [Archangium gephyra]|uniref:hypothetical protein n=1 Tax=Archangium gephyra TaxID=48 RepID=UPI003B7E12BF
MPNDTAAPPAPSRDITAQVHHRIKIVSALTASAFPLILLAGRFPKSTALLVLTPAFLLIVASVCYSIFVLCRCPICKAFLKFTRISSYCPGCGARALHRPEK